jgi:hypothetical protein
MFVHHRDGAMPTDISCDFIAPVSHSGSRNSSRTPFRSHTKLPEFRRHRFVGIITSKTSLPQ